MAFFTVWSFSASSSGISISNASSIAITSSTISSESAPRSSIKWAVGVTSASSTPNCSTIICFTFSSREAIVQSSSDSLGPVHFNSDRMQVTSAESKNHWAIEGRAFLNRPITQSPNHPILCHIHSAVDAQHVPGDISGFFRSQKADPVSHIGRSALPAHRNHAQYFLLHGFRKVLGHGGGDEAGRNGVHR